MSSASWTDAEVRARGWDALIERLGPAAALRFAIQTERGHGDYAEFRHRALGALSVDELLARVGQRRSRRPTGRKRRTRRRS
jgi:hypothetical protein